MIAFVISSIVLLAALMLITFRNKLADKEDRMAVLGVGSVLLVFGLLILFFDSYVIPSKNSVAVITEFNQPVGEPAESWTWVAPWAETSEFSTLVQVTDRKAGADGDMKDADCVKVNLLGGASACADMTLRYVVDKKDATDLWRRYGSFEEARNKLLRSATESAAKTVYGTYEPQQVISGQLAQEIADKMTATLSAQLHNSGLTLQAVVPGQVHLAPEVQNRLNDILNAQTATKVAEQELARNTARAAANGALVQSLTPLGELDKCLDVAKEIKVPGFTCSGAAPGLLLGGK